MASVHLSRCVLDDQGASVNLLPNVPIPLFDVNETNGSKLQAIFQLYNIPVKVDVAELQLWPEIRPIDSDFLWELEEKMIVSILLTTQNYLMHRREAS